MIVAPGFAGCVGNIGVDGVTEGRLVLRRHTVIRLRSEFYIKGAVRLGGGCSVCDLLALALWHWAPPVVPAPPRGVTYFTHDAPFDFGIIDGSAGISCGFACKSYFAIQFAGNFRSLDGYFKLWALVFFYIDAGTATRASNYLQAHPAKYAVSWGVKLAAERTIVISPVLLTRNLLAVPVTEADGHEGIWNCAVVVSSLINVIAEPFEFNGLTWAIQ